VSQRISGYARQGDDVYQTPEWATQLAVSYLRQQSCRHVWDCANGPDSKMSQTLRGEGFQVTATNNDFLAICSVPHNDIDGIATNPPYGRNGRLARQFIEHAHELVPVVAMLLRVDFDSGKTRTNLFRDCPAFAGKIVLLDRIEWFTRRKGAPGPSENHAWYVWNRRHRGPPTIGYARQP
jgi:hypothetical protein